jgi:hypothetical protein
MALVRRAQQQQRQKEAAAAATTFARPAPPPPTTSDLAAAITLLAQQQHQGNLLLHDIATQLRGHGQRLAGIEAACVGAWRLLARQASRAAAAAVAADLREWLAVGRAVAFLSLVLCLGPSGWGGGRRRVVVKQQQWWQQLALRRRKRPTATLLLLPTAFLQRWFMALAGWVVLVGWTCRAWRRWWWLGGVERGEEEERRDGRRVLAPLTRALLWPAACRALAKEGAAARLVAAALVDEAVDVALDAVVGGVGAWLVGGGGAATRPVAWALGLSFLWFPLSAWAWRESRRVGAMQALGLAVVAHLVAPFLNAAGAYL